MSTNSYHRHAQMFRPEPQRPVCYRTHRTLMQRLRPFVLGIGALGLVAAIALGAAVLITRLQVTQAQIDAAYLQGMRAGQTMCWSD
jgi:Tfp pilus assembly protein PilN